MNALLLCCVMLLCASVAWGGVVTLVNYEHAATLPAGITLSGTTAMASVKIHTNTETVDCIQLKNGYNASGIYNNNAIILTTDGGFKTGDTLTISGFFNNSDNTKVAKAEVFTKNAAGQCTAVWTSNQFVNGKLVNDDPIEESYTLTEDMDSIFIGRNGGTGANLYTIKVTRETSDPDPDPTPVPEPDPYPTPAPENGSIAWLAENTKTPYGFVTVTSRTATGTSYDLTGGGEYDVPTIQKMVVGLTRNTSHTVDGKRVIVLNPTASYMDTVILDAINGNDIIVFEGTESEKEFIVRRFISITASNKTIIGLNGARLKTEWQVDDQIKSWLNAVETSGGTGVSSASTNSGTGGWLVYGKKVDGKDSVEISEEGEFLTRQTLYSHYKDNATFPQNEDYRKAGIFFFSGCHNLILRNLIMEGPGSLDVGGYDLMALIDSTTHVWVDHCEFIDGEDGNLDITNLTDFITVSYCVFRYTDHSYVHQNTNLIGSSDTYTSPGGLTDDGKLNITWVANTWGAGCNSRMPMGRKGKIHLINNYYNCAGNAENAINPRIGSEFLVEQNYFAPGVRNIFKDGNSAAYTWSNNTVNDRNGNAPSENKGGAVSVPYGNMYSVEPRLVPEMTELLDGAVLDKVPTFTQNLPDSVARDLEEAQKGLIFSAWANHAYSFQWYQSDNKDMSGATPIEGETDNTYLCRPTEVKVVYLQCVAVGLAGKTASNILTLNIVSSRLPVFVHNLDDSKTYEVTSGSPQIFTVDAGDAVDGVEYQWYRSANADGSDSTAIDGDTAKSYTYNPAAAEVFYLFCVASNTLGHVDSKIVKVKGSYRDVKFCMYATYDKNISNTSVYVQGGTSNIDNIGTTEANIPADTDGCKAEANRADTISGLKFTAGTTHANPLGISAHFVPTSPIANDDKIEVSINTSSTSSASADYGFYVCKAAELGAENANVIGTITVNGKALKTQTFTATETLTDIYLIPFVGGAGKNINLANVVIYSGDIVVPIDMPAYTMNLEAENNVSKDGTLVLSVDYTDNDVSAIQWYKGADTESGTPIPDATTKTYSVPTSTPGVSYYYCVITGKGAFSEMTVPSVVAKVTVKEGASKDPLVWIFDKFGADNYEDTKKYAMVPYGTTTVVSVANGKELKFTDTATGESSASRVYTGLSETIGDNTIKSDFYIGGSGSLANRIFVTDALSGSGTLTIVYTSKSVDCNVGIYDNASTATALATSAVTKSKAYDFKLKDLDETKLRITHSGKARIGAIIWTPKQSAIVEKGIYSTTFSDWTTSKTAGDNTGRTENTTITQVITTKSNETITFTMNNCEVDNAAYYKIKEQKGVTTPGCVVAMKSNAAYNGTITSSVFNSITKIEFVEAVSGTNRGMGLKVKGTKEDGTDDADWVVVSDTLVDTGNARRITVQNVNRTNVQIQFYNLVPNQYGGLTDLVIYGMMEVSNCEEPTYTETWSGDENEKWNYEFTTTTEGANLHYTIDEGEEQTIAAVSGVVSVNPGQKIAIWAVDPTGDVPSSPIVEVTAPAKPATTTPNLKVGVYDVANHYYPVTIDGADAGASVYYTTDGTEPTSASTLYAGPFTVGQGVTVKAIAIRGHYTDSPILSYTTLTINLPATETFKTTGPGKDDAETKNIDNVLNPATIPGKHISGIDGATGLKYTINAETEQLDTDGETKIKGIQIDVHSDYVVTALNFADAYCNTSGKSTTLKRVFVDGAEITFDAKELPNSPKSSFSITGLKAKQRIVLEFVSAESSINQIRAAISPIYEFDDDIAETGDDIVTIDGVAISDANLATLKTTGTVEIPEPMYAEDPVVLMKSKLGYTYTLENKAYDSETKYNSFQKTFIDKTYTVKVKVNDVKSPTITIDDNFTLLGGYKVTLGAYSPETTPYIKLDNGEWEVYDPAKSYYALKTVRSKVGYTEGGESLETEPRTANCPTNDYEVGKPFAVMVRQRGYYDTGAGQSGAAYETELDQIYRGLTNQFNVIDLQIDDKDKSILETYPEINFAKLVVITEMVSGSGKYEVDGKSTGTTALAYSLQHDVVDHTNVLNMKMFLYSQSKNNQERWGWAQPATLPYEAISILPVNPMFEVFRNVNFNADGAVNLWHNIPEEGTLNHIQPCHNINEENAPEFIPLAMAYDAAGEEYQAMHCYRYDANTQYIGLGLSINDFTRYDENLFAIIDQIGALIREDRDLYSEIQEVPIPRIRDNGTGSATISNNNPHCTTYYTALNESDFETFMAKSIDAQIAQIEASGLSAQAGQFETQKYKDDCILVAVSEYNSAHSLIAHEPLKGNRTRYIIRRDVSGAYGLEAAWPFLLSADGTATIDTFPYNQSWSRPGYTVKKWVTNPEDVKNPGAVGFVPGRQYHFTAAEMMHDIMVYAVWEANNYAITDLTASEGVEERTVKWEFLPSKGAPKIQIEHNPNSTNVYPTKAVLVGQVKFRRDTENPSVVTDWIDVPLNIDANPVSITTPEGQVLANGGKFVNRAFYDKAPGTYATDYAQVRTGTLMTLPAVYGMTMRYHQMAMNKVDTTSLREKSVSYITQSYITDGTMTGENLNKWPVTNPGLKTNASGALVLDGNKKPQIILDNLATGGLFSYTGEGMEATLHTVESAVFTLHDDSTKAGRLNSGSCFMDNLVVTYPALYDLTLTWVPAKSELDPTENPGKMTKLNDPHANWGDRYMLDEQVKLQLAPAYGYYADVDDAGHDYYLMKNGETPLVFGDDEYLYRYRDLGYSGYSDSIKALIPEDGAYIDMKVKDIDLFVTMKPYLTRTYSVTPYPSRAGTIRIDSHNGREADYEYPRFADTKPITISATPKAGYKFKQWEKETNRDVAINTGDIPGVTINGDHMEVIVDATNAAIRYLAVFEPGKTGTTTYDLNHAILLNADSTVEQDSYVLTDAERLGFEGSATGTAMYIPAYYTLYKDGYTLIHWEETIDGNPVVRPLGSSLYYETESESHIIRPVFRKNPDGSEFLYRKTDVDITWDFRVSRFAQVMDYDVATEQFDRYSTHATFNDSMTIDVPLLVRGSMKNTIIDDWASIGQGAEIVIPSGLGATFYLATYAPISSTNIDGDTLSEYTIQTDGGIPYYLYTYVTPSADTVVTLTIGDDYSYYKYVRAQLPSADKVDIYAWPNNDAMGSIVLTSPVGITPRSRDRYTVALGTDLTFTITRNHYYQLRCLVLDGDTITAGDAESKGYTWTEDEANHTYTFGMQMTKYESYLEAVFENRPRYQITFTAGRQASGQAPSVIVVEQGENFTMPVHNNCLYVDGHTLMYWLDEDGEKYYYNTTYPVPHDLYLTPVFERYAFTRMDLTEPVYASWPLTRAEGSPLLQYQGISGLIVAQVYRGDSALNDYIDLQLLIDAGSGKVDNTSYDNRCQINSGSIFDVVTSPDCEMSVYTVGGHLSTTTFAGEKLTSERTGSGTDEVATVHYTKKNGSEELRFLGDANYFSRVTVKYNPYTPEDRPELTLVTLDNIALGAIGSPYEHYSLATLQENKSITIPITLTGERSKLPVVKAKVDREGTVAVEQATLDNPSATIVVNTKDGARVGVYTINYEVTYDLPAPVLKNKTINGMNTDFISGIKQGTNGVINLTFDHEMKAFSIDLWGQTLTADPNSKLSFLYWDLQTDRDYTFTIPANTLEDVYGNKYGEAISFTFHTRETSSSVVEHRVVNFVVTHTRSYTFNTTNPEENYTAGERVQMPGVSDELLSNLRAADIAYGTIDEGLALAHLGSSEKRYYIFVPNGEYQLRGNAATDAIKQAASNGAAPADKEGNPRSELMGKKIYNGMTRITRSNLSITGQSMEGAILWNLPEVEGISYTSTLFPNAGTSGLYLQDLTLENRFDYRNSILHQGTNTAQAARGVVYRERSTKSIMKHVFLKSYQDTYYSNVSNQFDDIRGYLEDSKISGYVDFICGDADIFFNRCTLELREGKTSFASNMVAPSQYDNQEWGYVLRDCRIVAEDAQAEAVNQGKFTMGRPWKNSPALSLISATMVVQPTTDGYKQMTASGLVLRMHEYGSLDANGTPLDLSGRSLRNSSPGVGSYDAVMTRREADRYTIHNVLGGDDGYDPTIHTAQRPPVDDVTFDDYDLSWSEDKEALCYMVFAADGDQAGPTGPYNLLTVTTALGYNCENHGSGWYIIRALNQRGGLGEPTEPIYLDEPETYELTLNSVGGRSNRGWSTICLPYNAIAPRAADYGIDQSTDTFGVFAAHSLTAYDITLTQVNHLTANVGYVVYGLPTDQTAAGVPYKFYQSSHPNEGIESILNGNPKSDPIDASAYPCYTLAYKPDLYGVGFYPFTGKELKANRAWLDADSVFQVRNNEEMIGDLLQTPVRIHIEMVDLPDRPDIPVNPTPNPGQGEGTPTEVRETEAEIEENIRYYDLLGHSVDEGQHLPNGIYIRKSNFGTKIVVITK